MQCPVVLFLCSFLDHARIHACRSKKHPIEEYLEWKTIYRGRSALHAAAMNGYAVIVKMLLDAHADPNVEDTFVSFCCN